LLVFLSFLGIIPAKNRIQNTEYRIQNTEYRSQKSEDRRQKAENRSKSKTCLERSRMDQKSKCKITVQKSKIPRLAVALVATVCSTIVENPLQIGLFFCKTKPIFEKVK